MASVNGEQKSPAKTVPNGNHQISKVKLDLNHSNHMNNSNGLSDKNHETLIPPNTHSLPVKHSTLNGSTHTKLLSNNESPPVLTQCKR